jgi:hypothetical protein
MGHFGSALHVHQFLKLEHAVAINKEEREIHELNKAALTLTSMPSTSPKKTRLVAPQAGQGPTATYNSLGSHA